MECKVLAAGVAIESVNTAEECSRIHQYNMDSLAVFNFISILMLKTWRFSPNVTSEQELDSNFLKR